MWQRNNDSILVAVGRLEGRLAQLDEMRDTLNSIQGQLREQGRGQGDLDRRLSRLEQVYEEYQARMPEIRKEYVAVVERTVREQTEQIKDQVDDQLRPFRGILSAGKKTWAGVVFLIGLFGASGLITVLNWVHSTFMK